MDGLVGQLVPGDRGGGGRMTPSQRKGLCRMTPARAFLISLFHYEHFEYAQMG